MLIAYTYDKDGYFVKQVSCQRNPIKQGEFLIPASSTTVNPGSAAENMIKQWNGNSWDEVDNPTWINSLPNLIVLNEYGVPTNEISGNQIVERDSEDVDSETEVIAWLSLRGQRDAKIASVEWKRTRHKDEIELSLSTSMSGSEYTELLEYIQELRDITDGIADPVAWLASPAWPTEPS